jgi:ribose 5-phosphate isomerase
VDEVEETEKRIKLLPGVIECGLFVGICDVAVIGFADHVEVRYRS